ncbi:adenylyltransferase/cytidyltransferase family protein [Patescibacteria group bacterium]|nr:adenylyltransferase/cytidyltransferase family protein [Patescibacteria group bacterium]MBU2259537.1 adenylyltransferase/cytidyltransferase family protein [Patescibacteria group bacterium]
MRVLVFGTFDNLHPGHKFLLNEAQQRGELWVVIGLDETVKRVKGFYPVQSQEERKHAVEKAFPQARVLLGDSEDYFQPIRNIKPGLILLGYDQELPPEIDKRSFPCRVECLSAYKPEEFKSSLRRKVIDG